MLIEKQYLAPVFGAIIGAIIGSFLNVVIHRLPKMMYQSWRKEFALTFPEYNLHFDDDKISLVQPRSFCPRCRKGIRIRQNIPILSWLILRGRCAQCQGKISLQYPTVEAVSAISSYIVCKHFGCAWMTLSTLLFTYFLIIVSYIDINTKLLPDSLTLLLLWIGVTLSFFDIGTVHLRDSVAGAIVGYLFLWGFYWAFKILTGKEGMGHGDFKMLAALASWTGWQAVPSIVLLSSLLGLTFGLIQIFSTKGYCRLRTFAFGPYLALAGWTCLLWKYDFMRWYIPYIRVAS